MDYEFYELDMNGRIIGKAEDITIQDIDTHDMLDNKRTFICNKRKSIILRLKNISQKLNFYDIKIYRRRRGGKIEAFNNVIEAYNSLPESIKSKSKVKDDYQHYKQIYLCVIGLRKTAFSYTWFTEENISPEDIHLSKKTKKVYMYDAYNNLITSFNSVETASMATVIPENKIYNMLNGIAVKCDMFYRFSYSPNIAPLQRSIRIVQYNGHELIYKYLNVKMASFATGIKASSIYNCLRGLTKKAGGYSWFYEDELL